MPVITFPQPIQIYEDMPGAKATATSFSVDYNIINAPVTGNPSNDYATVRALVLAYAPVSNAPPGATYAWPRRGLDLRETGWGTWKATVQWASLNYQYAYKISGSSQQIRSDKQLSGIFVDSGALAAARPPIPWATMAGRSAGMAAACTVLLSGSRRFPGARRWRFPSASTASIMRRRWLRLGLSPVNKAAFRGKDANQVLFQGYSAQVSTQNPDSVIAVYEFKAGANYNADNDNQIKIDNISSINKNAWDWLDVHYTPPQFSSGATAAYPPKADYVLTHRVYDTSDFSQLNIGTSEALPMWQGPVQ